MSAAAAAAAAAASTSFEGDAFVEDDVMDHGARIERLLDAAESAAGPVAWPRIEALIAALVDLYGSGLDRIVASAREEARSAPKLDTRLAHDELVSSLLLLHGIHPVSLEDRIHLALERMRSSVPAIEPLELVEVNGDGVVVLRAGAKDEHDAAGDANAANAEPFSLPSLHVQLVAGAIERAAPEVKGVRIEGLVTPETSPSAGFVPVERLHRRSTEAGERGTGTGEVP